jgi:23S rRNA pseudoU1915 N3-methylase RlmH
LKLYLVSFGKLKTPGLREAADYYLKLIQPWVTFEEIELKPLHVGDKSASSRKQIQEEEGEILSQKLSKLLTAARFISSTKGEKPAALRTGPSSSAIGKAKAFPKSRFA